MKIQPAALLLLTHLCAVTTRQGLAYECNTFNPQCGLTLDEAKANLKTYQELKSDLESIENLAAVPMKVGPLVRNGGNGGLIDIDKPINKRLCKGDVNCDVCGIGTGQSSTGRSGSGKSRSGRATIREAVVCTVPEGSRGNRDETMVGKSNKGRDLLGARIGNSKGKKVLIATQIHGNEAAGTEAALNVLRDISQGNPILEHLDILFLLRANPDAGERDGVSFPFPFQPYLGSPPPDGFFRENIDPKAGGGFVNQTEDDFFGVVGRGYNLNRYVYAKFDQPIRPVEAQAMVAVLHAFKPDVVFDMHGDVPKSACDLNITSLGFKTILGGFPAVKCREAELLPEGVPTLSKQDDRKYLVEGSLFADNDKVGTSATRLAQQIATDVFTATNDKLEGNVLRFSQTQGGAGRSSGGTLGSGAEVVGAASSGWDIPIFGEAFRPDVFKSPPTATGDIFLNTHEIEPCFLEDSICIHELFLEEGLKATVKYAVDGIDDEPGYCNIPVNMSNIGTFPGALGWAEIGAEVEELTQIPAAGQFGIPAGFSGSCPQDPIF